MLRGVNCVLLSYRYEPPGGGSDVNMQHTVKTTIISCSKYYNGLNVVLAKK